MKKLLAIFTLFALVASLSLSATQAKAQRNLTTGVTISKTAVVNTDTSTVTFTSVENGVTSFSLHALKDTGTISGKVVFFGYNNKVWKHLDSTTYSAASLETGGVLSFTFPAKHSTGELIYSQYKIVISESVMGRVKTITGEFLRRSN
jgi:hypothetical protein